MNLLKQAAIFLAVCMVGLCTWPSGMADQAELWVEYSNLVEPQTLHEFSELLTNRGAARRSVQVITKSIKEYNDTVGTNLLTNNGTLFLSSPLPAYDLARMDERWQSRHGDFIGYNCRITAFELMKDFIRIDDAASITASPALFMDQEALDTSADGYFDADERAAFNALFSAIPTTSSINTEEHISVQREYWNRIGVHFAKGQLSLITVYIHNHFSDTDNELLAGHAGILAKVGNEYLFFEKLSFQMPYQLIRFHSKDELWQYLMALYDTDTTGECAKPFVLENDHLLCS